MSLQTMKKKSTILHGTNRSVKGPGGMWITPRHNGPIYSSDSGFSLQGGHRNKGRVGQSSAMSKSGTPYKGIYPKAHGGIHGRYPTPQPLLNAPPVRVDISGNQHLYIKPSVLSTRGMMRGKYKWAYTGMFPNYWVQPNYTGNQTDTSSQGMYIRQKASAYVSDLGVSVEPKDNVIKTCESALGCNERSTAGRTYNNIASSGKYSKNIRQPTTYDTYNMYLTRKCDNPTTGQKPFPYAVQTGRGVLRGGITVGSGGACNTSVTYNEAPAWYTE
jgi:hypothetical protein